MLKRIRLLTNLGWVNHIVIIRVARETGTEKDMRHTSRVLFQKKRLLKNSRILLKEIHIRTVMTRNVGQTGTVRDIDRILQTIQILIILNIREGTKHILVLLPLECTFTKIEYRSTIPSLLSYIDLRKTSKIIMKRESLR